MTSILSGCTKPVSCAARTGAHRVHPRRSSHRCAAHPVQEASAPEVRPADRAEGCSSATGGVRINPRWKQAVTGQSGLYFVVNNNFKVKKEHCDDFEDMWRTRESRLKEMPGFIRFAMLRCDQQGEYVSQTTWASRDDFMAWTQSNNFKQSHRAPPADENGSAPKKPSVRDMLEGPPQPKLYEAVTVTENTLM